MKLSYLRLFIIALVAGTAISSLTSCHTTAGLGTDIQDAGRGMQRAVNRAR